MNSATFKPWVDVGVSTVCGVPLVVGDQNTMPQHAVGDWKEPEKDGAWISAFALWSDVIPS